MPLDYSKLEKVRQTGGGAVARCPACAAQDGDQHGNHLRIDASGRFCCVTHPGKAGMWHRREIFRLAGERRKERTEPVKLHWRLKR